MKTVSVADVKTRLIELIEQLGEGDEVVITRHGQAVARLTSVPRIRLTGHSISAPIPLAYDTMSAGLDEIDSGLITLF